LEIEYPIIKTSNTGLIVQMSKGRQLPGVFLSYLDAERAIAKVENKQAEVNELRANSKKNK